MASVFGIVYATKSKAIRRIVIPDDDQYLDIHPLADGETMLVHPIGPHDLETCRGLVKEETGVTPGNGLSAVVDPNTNLVISVIAADPELDAVKGYLLVERFHSEIDKGCIYDPVKEEFTKPQHVTPAGTEGRDGVPSTEDKIEPEKILSKDDVAGIGEIISP